MEEHVYDPSIFWIALDKLSEPFLLIGPIIIVVAVSLWAIKTKEKSCYVAVIGALLLLGSHVSHALVEKMHWVHISGRIPAVEENPIVFFFFIHGMSYGYMLLSVPLAIYFFKLYRNA